VLEFILPIQQILFLLSSLMLLLLGLYIANLWHGLLLIEKLGGRLWVRVEPWARKLLPIQHLPQAFFAGMLWGWLPCGLVYSVLIGALASGSAQNGAIMMLMFGLGTLPMLISLGFASAKLKPVLQSERLRMICGGMIAMFGIMGLYRLFW
jgi:sulfite exporter TauE/SafE